MKKRGTVIGILLAVIGILLLFCLGIYLALDWNRSFSGVQNPDPASSGAAETGAVSSQEDASSGPDAQTAAALAALQDADGELPEHHIIFVGDSRTVGMGEAEAETGDACTYIGAVGEGYQWFVDCGMAEMENAIAQYPEAFVVLNLGVNDPDNIDSYLELYRSFSESYPETSFYFLSVNPVEGESVHITNEEIASFNRALQDAFPETYLDCSTYLRTREFETVDGVHYSQDTYRLIHDFTVRELY